MKTQLRQLLWGILFTILLTASHSSFAFFDPTIGTFISRDPIEERGGLNLHGFVGNDGINGADSLGLWHWKNGKRDGHPRATVVPDKNCDSYSDLAALVKLDQTEVKQWLESWKPNSQVTPCDEFTVPNTVYVNLLTPMSFHLEWFWWPYSRGEINKFTSQGYFALFNENVDSRTVLNQLSAPDIFGFENIADGDLNEPGTLQTTDNFGLRPNIKSVLHYKLGGLKMIECFGGVLPWYQLVSPNGYYWASVSYVHIWDAPAHGF